MRNKELARARFRRYYWKHKDEIRIKRTGYNKEYRNKHRTIINEKSTWSYLRRTYGVTQTDYNNMMRLQNSACKICKEKPLSKLCVDHDHKTGKVRGLLCHSCNNSLGLLKESISVLQSMIQYIEENKGD